MPIPIGRDVFMRFPLTFVIATRPQSFNEAYKVLKDENESMWSAYVSRIDWPLRPALARGAKFSPEARVAAGLEPEFIRRLQAAARS